MQIDFTWEREWRLNLAELTFTPNDAALIVPDRAFAEYLKDQHDMEQEYSVELYSVAYGRRLAEQYRQDFPWRIFPLRP